MASLNQQKELFHILCATTPQIIFNLGVTMSECVKMVFVPSKYDNLSNINVWWRVSIIKRGPVSKPQYDESSKSALIVQNAKKYCLFHKISTDDAIFNV